MKQSSDVPKAYIKEKYIGKKLNPSYAPRSIPINEIKRKIGPEAYRRIAKFIDANATSKLIKS